MRGLRVVIADPGLEQVAEQVQGARAPDRTGQEAQEPRGDPGRRRVEVQVRSEPDGHCAGSAFASAGGWGAGAAAVSVSTTYARLTRGRSTGTSPPKFATVSVRR